MTKVQTVSDSHLLDMLVEFAFELIALSTEANVRVDPQVPLQMALQIVFVHEFGVANIAKVVAWTVTDSRVGQQDKLVVGVGGF